MSPKQFLQIGGLALVLVAVLGFIGIIGSTPEQSVFGPSWYFDNGENWAHLVLGVVAFAAAYVLGESMQKTLVRILGFVGVLVGIYSLFSSIPAGINLLGAQLQNPLDTILHLAIGLWALMAAKGKKMEMMPQ